MEKYILMIDDDLDDFMVLTEILSKYSGLRCHYACDAATGIEMIKANRPDAVVLDLNMPAISGFDCLKMIKGNPDIASIPVIIFSTSISEATRHTLLQTGAKQCLQKPSSYEDYKAVVTEILDIINAGGQDFIFKTI